MPESLKDPKTTPGGRRIPHDLRVELYHFVRELNKSGIGYRRIQKIVVERYGVWISRSNISYWVRGMHTPEREPYNKPDFSKPEMAWIAGMLAGDGSIKVNKIHRNFSNEVVFLYRVPFFLCASLPLRLSSSSALFRIKKPRKSGARMYFLGLRKI